MQETVASVGERKSLFSSYLEVLETRERQAAAERQLQDEKYLRRTQRIYEFHERQRREAVELKRCLEYVSQHAQVLETVLRGCGSSSSSEAEVPLGAALVRQAAHLQRCMLQCVANAAKIRTLLSAAHRDQMDTLLGKMEAELGAWTAFLQRSADATLNSETVVDNLHNLIAEQRRCVREVSSSTVFRSLCEAEREHEASGEPSQGLHSPPRASSRATACSTPIARD